MAHRLPLSALLSFALVAFTIEADNEAEHRLPHRTSRYGATETRGAWLTSMAMWFNCLCWIPEQGIAVREVERLARTRTNWDGMRRWGHIYFEPSPTDKRPKPPLSVLMVRATANGRLSQEVWRELMPEMEQRWSKRLGQGVVASLRTALAEIAGQLDAGLPDCLPILRYGLVNPAPKPQKSASGAAEIEGLPLPALLARVLLVFALEFERESEISLAIEADVMRVMEGDGTAVRDLPHLSGVSKEAVAMALSYLTKQGLAVVKSEGRSSGLRMVWLTPEGIRAQHRYGTLTAAIEMRWSERYGKRAIERLRNVLEPLTGDGTADVSLVFAGIKPYPEGWRAKTDPPATLPHFPMVLHRGGYPDGS